MFQNPFDRDNIRAGRLTVQLTRLSINLIDHRAQPLHFATDSDLTGAHSRVREGPSRDHRIEVPIEKKAAALARGEMKIEDHKGSTIGVIWDIKAKTGQDRNGENLRCKMG